MRKASTMKKWGILSWGAALILTGIAVYSCFEYSIDSETMLGLTTLAWAEVGVYTGAYAYKEKAENKQKIAAGLITDLAQEYGLEALAPIIESVIGE